MSNIYGLGDLGSGGNDQSGNNPGGNGNGQGGGGGGGSGMDLGAILANMFAGGGQQQQGQGQQPGQQPGSSSGAEVHFSGDGKAQLMAFLRASAKASGLAVVDFTASWCGPCKMIAPVFAQLSQQFPDVLFVKVDVDECQQAAQECGVSAMPTFHFYDSSGTMLEELRGANPASLRDAVARLRPQGGGSAGGAAVFTGSGHRLGGAGAGATPEQSSPQPTQQPPQMQPQMLGMGGAGQRLGISEGGVAGAPGGSGVANPVFLANLTDMGFGEAHATAGLIATGNASLEAAIDWLATHEPPAEPSPQQPAPAITAATTAPAGAPALAPATPDTTMAEAGTSETDAAPRDDGTPSTTDNAGAGTPGSDDGPTLHSAVCDSCVKQIVGIRYKCKSCADFDLCAECKAKFDANPALTTHDMSHSFYEYEKDPYARGVTRDTPRTEAELAADREKVKQMIAAKRAQREAQEKAAEKEAELSRRASARESAKSREEWKDEQVKRERIQRQKEKDADIAHKQRLKEQMERDRLERLAARKAAAGGVPVAQQQQQEQQTPAVDGSNYDTCNIAFRMPDGSTTKATFKPSDPVRLPLQHISMLLNRSDVSIMTTFPRRVFKEGDANLDLTLKDADLVPSGLFVVR